MQLSGDDSENELGNGISVTGPGLRDATVEVRETVDTPTTEAGQRFQHALDNSGFERRPPVVISHKLPATGTVKVRFPAAKPGNRAVLLVHDATGGLTWHVPTPHTPTSHTPTPHVASVHEGVAAVAAPAAAAAPASSDLQFEIPGSRFGVTAAPPTSAPVAAAGAEGLAAGISVPGVAKKALSVLEFPVGHLLAWGAKKWIDHWDRNKHAPVVRWFPPTGGLSVGEALSPTNWSTLSKANGPVLLFIHGIFSSCSNGFGGIAGDTSTWPALQKLYNGRIIGYDHPTVSVAPADNAQYFLDQIPDGVEVEVDIVCHSRGGLVARALAGQVNLLGAGKVTVRKIIFVATPNGGSEITVDSNWSALVDRISSMLTAPASVLPIPIDEAASLLAGVLELIKVVGVATADQLPGLDAMRPGGPFLNQLGSYQGQTPEYFAAEADFRPPSLLANVFHVATDVHTVGEDVLDQAVFHMVRNDVAVPTNGVADPADPDGPPPPASTLPPVPGFPLAADHVLPIGPGSVIWHCIYFADQDMRNKLVEWLS